MDKYFDLVNDKLSSAYAPYSEFSVACLIVSKNDTLTYGVNVENASYGATICAERNAMTTYITNDLDPKDIKQIYITSHLGAITPPCGICRQFLLEFVNKDVEIYLLNSKKEYKLTNIDELLPIQFNRNDLGV